MLPKLTKRPDGTKEWWLDGKLHRVDEYTFKWPDGTRVWYLNGKLHRVDGPAVERSNGTKEWWLDGKLWTALRQPSDNAGQVWWVMAKMSGAK